MPHKPIRVGILGFGNAFRVFHEQFITSNPAFELYAILQRSSPEEARAANKRVASEVFPNIKLYKTQEEFLADPDIDLVLVLTRNEYHYETAKAAILAKKHVVVEKPFVPSSKQAQELIDLSKKTGKVLTVFHNRRYDSDFLTLKKVYTAGLLGEMVHCDMHFDIDFPDWAQRALNRTPDDWTPPGGMNFGIGCHTLDQALSLFGTPKSVTAIYRFMRDTNLSQDPKEQRLVEDTFDMYLQYGPEKHGLLVECRTAIISRQVSHLKYFARGREGTFIKFGIDQQEDQINAGMKSTDPAFGVEPVEWTGTLTSEKEFPGSAPKPVKRGTLHVGPVKTETGNYYGYYNDVARAINGERDVEVKPETARDNIRIIELARQSWLEGRTIPFHY